jgi:SHS2 domain-containing protein
MSKELPASSGAGVFREIEHTADLAIEVTARDLPSLFAVAGEGLYSLIVDPSTVELREEILISVTVQQGDELLHAWLRELLGAFNVQGFVGKTCEMIEVTGRRAEGKLKGEKLDLARHRFHTEIKGVTYHDFAVWQSSDGWHARIIFDV